MADGPLRSTLRLGDLLAEALAGALQRPSRSALTMLGTVLGIGAFVAILGLTATTQGQIDKRFTALTATEVTVEDVGRPHAADNPISFPADAARRIETLAGVKHAGLLWPVSYHPQVSGMPVANAADGDTAVLAVAPGALEAARPALASGRLYGKFHQDRAEAVAVLGGAAAARLGIHRLDAQPAVFIDGTPYPVVGIIADVARRPELLLSVLIPTSTALHRFGPPTEERAEMLIDTRLGAARLVAAQAALRLRPDAPDLLKVIPPPDPRRLRQEVAGDLNVLLFVLAALSVVIGGVGIANTTLVAVLERRYEIGLRRALGARPRHIIGQFLLEATGLGLLGGLVGTCLAIACVVGVALVKQWTAILEPWAVLPAPLAGAVVGLLAGLYPALRAARIEPVEALRR